MNLSGSWKGKYTYGEGYPLDLMGKSEPFEFDLKDVDGIISGTCTDEIVNKIEGNESSIEGVFHNNYISFIKKYKYPLILEEPGNPVSADDVKFDGIHYTGRLYKKIFWGKVYFSGEWTITSEYTDKNKEKYVFTVEGTWKMSRNK